MHATRQAAAPQPQRPQQLALFISDLHLQQALPATTQAFKVFLQNHAMRAERLYLLGDIFEYWAGDDDIDSPYASDIVAALREVSDSGVTLFWIGGNRDFLAGEAFAQRAGLTLLPDPHVAEIAGRRILLAHGDAQCTDDHAYMAFRAQVRDAAWQLAFLAQPLAQRKKIIEGLRHGSREAQRGKSYEIMDVNTGAIDALFDATGTSVMIHGHTHRPARHVARAGGGGRERIRYVLPDWDCDAEPRRGGWIAIGVDGEIRRYGLDGEELR